MLGWLNSQFSIPKSGLSLGARLAALAGFVALAAFFLAFAAAGEAAGKLGQLPVLWPTEDRKCVFRIQNVHRAKN